MNTLTPTLQHKKRSRGRLRVIGRRDNIIAIGAIKPDDIKKIADIGDIPRSDAEDLIRAVLTGIRLPR